jgi:hypothetical protein
MGTLNLENHILDTRMVRMHHQHHQHKLTRTTLQATQPSIPYLLKLEMFQDIMSHPRTIPNKILVDHIQHQPKERMLPHTLVHYIPQRFLKLLYRNKTTANQEANMDILTTTLCHQLHIQAII